jgi:phage terminase small subunit
MPHLKAAHERFVQEYVANGRNGQDAYMAAFPKSGKRAARRSAYRLLARVEVKSRVAEMQGKSAERSQVTLDNLIKEAADIQRAAMDANSYAAAIAALIARAKLCGLWVERTQGENTHVIYAVSDEPMSEEEWERQYVRPG